MTLERLQLLLDVYGSHVDRWPPHDRRAAETLLEISGSARARLAAAQRLDALLDRAMAPAAPSPGLRERVLAIAPGAGARTRTVRWWRSRPALVTAASGMALAASLALWLMRSPAPGAPLDSAVLAQLGVFDVPTDALLFDTTLGFGDETPVFGCDDPALGCDDSPVEPQQQSGQLVLEKEVAA
jgi:hypothetical protein